MRSIQISDARRPGSPYIERRAGYPVRLSPVTFEEDYQQLNRNRRKASRHRRLPNADVSTPSNGLVLRASFSACEIRHPCPLCSTSRPSLQPPAPPPHPTPPIPP